MDLPSRTADHTASNDRGTSVFWSNPARETGSCPFAQGPIGPRGCLLTALRPYVAGTLSVLGTLAFGTSNAVAANCQDFTVGLQNEARIEIKAVKFEYKDGSKWKTENIFGIDGYERIDLYNTSSFKRNLQGIGDENTQFRVTYKLDDGYTTYGLKKWGDDIVETVNTFKCHDNGTFNIRLYATPVAWQ